MLYIKENLFNALNIRQLSAAVGVTLPAKYDGAQQYNDPKNNTCFRDQEIMNCVKQLMILSVIFCSLNEIIAFVYLPR